MGKASVGEILGAGNQRHRERHPFPSRHLCSGGAQAAGAEAKRGGGGAGHGSQPLGAGGQSPVSKARAGPGSWGLCRVPKGAAGMWGAPPSTPEGRALGNQLATGTGGCLWVSGSRRAPASPLPQGLLHFPVPLGAHCAPGAPAGSVASCQDRPQAQAASLAPAWPRGLRWAGSEGWAQPCSAWGSPSSQSPRGEGLGKQGKGQSLR